jgi:cytochrome c2
MTRQARLFGTMLAAALAAGLVAEVGRCVADDPQANDRARGAAAIRYYGCGTCHRIPGIAGATGTVGPSLERLHRRVYIGGFIPNTPGALAQWIESPRKFDPRTAMPDMGVSAGDARLIAAFLSRTP